jgi:hypothetical protein
VERRLAVAAFAWTPGLSGRRPPRAAELHAGPPPVCCHPHLPTETGPFKPEWKTLLTEQPDRLVMGMDVRAPQLLKPLDRLMLGAPRVLGELPPAVADRIVHVNAERRFRRMGPGEGTT